MTADFENPEDYIALVREAMEGQYSREGNHVSNIILCPRQRVFKQIDRLPITDKDLSIYSSGRAVHEALYEQSIEKEKYVQYNDIEGKVKCTYRIPKSQIVAVYYMAMQNSPIGYMVQVTMNEEERKSQLKKLVRETMSLQDDGET